jgi:DNA-binding HxlR family transcriptional regulator
MRVSLVIMTTTFVRSIKLLSSGCTFFHSGIKRPGELKRHIPDTTRRVLDTQLNQLVAHGLLSKTIFPGLPLKVEYELTDLCKPLIPVINTVVGWVGENRGELETLIKNSKNI